MVSKKPISILSNAKLPVPNAADSAAMAFNNLVEAWRECRIVSEQEKTKRENIRSFRDVNIKAIEDNSKILKMYLKNTFLERESVIQGMFDRLDKGIEVGDNEIVSMTIEAIVNVTKQSPLAGAKELLANYRDPNVTMIEI